MGTTVSVTKDELLKALATVLQRKTFGIVDMDILDVEGVIETGEAFSVEGIRVTVRRKQASPVEKLINPTPPAGLGKIKLASVNGERL